MPPARRPSRPTRPSGSRRVPPAASTPVPPAGARPDAPPPSARRQQVERRSAPVLALLSSQPKVFLPLLAVVLLVGELALPRPVGVLPGVLLLALVGWLSYLSWPVLVPQARLARVVLLALLVVLTVTRI